MRDGSTIDAFDLEDEPLEATPTTRTYLIVQREQGVEVLDLEEGGVVSFGRDPESTICLDDQRVSREHARIRRSKGAITVVDLGSRNGTSVGGDVLRGGERRLASGDIVTIGGAQIVVAVALWQTASVVPTGESSESALLPSGVVAADPGMVEVFRLARRVAQMPTTVLVLGETGVGKEVVAEQIHAWSPRAKNRFVRLNCASLPATLLESELFGHEKGAFTGADKRKIGYLESAHSGTLFLDEIGELSSDTQVKLLRVLEDRRFARIGGTQEIELDVRIIAATHCDLKAQAHEGRFREDLYFRLSAFTLTVPPLRERPAEIALLAERFVHLLSGRAGRSAPKISPSALGALRRYRWPGNVRELRNAIEHALVVCDRGEIDEKHLPEAVRQLEGGTAGGPMRDKLAELERKSIEEALAAEGGNQTRAAKRLGISRRALLYKLEKYGIGR